MPTETRTNSAAAYAPPSAASATVDSDERLHTLDILRGLALCFMVLVHFHQRLRVESSTGIQDLIGWGVWIFVEQKSWGVFAILFGAGFAIFLRRLEARGAPVAPVYLRRLASLAVIGWLVQRYLGFHVLVEYAGWGVALLVMRRWPTRALLAVAATSAMARPTLVAAMGMLQQYAGGPGPAALTRSIVWPLVPDTNLVLFIVGFLAVRLRVVDEPLRHARLVRTWMIGGAAAWAISWLVLYHVPEELPVRGTYWALRTGFGLIADQWLAFTYAGGVLLLLAARPALQQRLSLFGVSGRMALTNYVLQAATFYVLDARLGVKLLDLAQLGGTIVLFGGLVVFSRAWLARFRYGPLEWIWRMATYARRQPLRRADGAAVQAMAA